MDLKEWRAKRQGERMVLPSGLVVTVRQVDILDLAVQGEIPTPLVAAADQYVNGVKLKMDDFKAAAPVINLVVSACLVAPAVAEVADETHLAVGELSMQDRLAVYNWANSGVAQLTPFRDEEGKPG